MNIFNANIFAPDPSSRSLLYQRCCPRPSPHQVVNVSSIDKLINCRSHSTCSSMFSQTLIGADSPWSYNPCPRSSYNFYHHFDMANNLKTMNQELS